MKKQETHRNSIEIIRDKILLIRGKRVMLDRDLAALYGVETKQLKRAVRRNVTRFPSDFMFPLSKKELSDWRRQFGTSNFDKMGLRYSPMAFTEQGVAMLSSVLNSDYAIKINIQIMRAFVKMREFLATNKELAEMVKENREVIIKIIQTIDALKNPAVSSPKRRIRFHNAVK
ncbi:MAG: ORF6N domain-containing protein [Candidatus Omnitrophica bacterium]|nr:ORF6N domain-containing protein [Candidatus Omnitrophota bacterium]